MERVWQGCRRVKPYLQGFLVMVVVAGAIWALIYVPRMQIPICPPDQEGLPPKICFDIENEARKTLAYILGGLLAIIGITLAHRRILALERQVLVAQEGQITERFTRAIEQLGSDRMEVRLGGIYALERIANDSDKDYWPIMETLMAFVRENAPWREPPSAVPAETGGDEAGTLEGATSPAPAARPKPATDIQAILTVLGRRKYKFMEGEDKQLDLSNTDLRGIVLIEAHLEGIIFWDTHMEGATLSLASLELAEFQGAHLQKAALVATHLENSDLTEAHLEGANLNMVYLEGAEADGVYLEEANLSEAHLERASLNNARLDDAILKGTHLERADLDGAHLEGANLEGAHLEGVSLRKAHLKRANFRKAQLEKASLHEAHLEEAILVEAHLEKAVLMEAHLERALLMEAHLEGAFLSRAYLEGAYLSGAYLERAVLRRAHLEGAYLIETHLERADLRQAHLDRAVLMGAHLEGADLRDAIGLTREQLAQAIIDDKTQLPYYLREGPAENDEE